MTINEAIEHALEVANTTNCEECKQDHLQLASCLEELVELRKQKEQLEKALDTAIDQLYYTSGLCPEDGVLDEKDGEKYKKMWVDNRFDCKCCNKNECKKTWKEHLMKEVQDERNM